MLAGIHFMFCVDVRDSVYDFDFETVKASVLIWNAEKRNMV
jgi:hypothetical protein